MSERKELVARLVTQMHLSAPDRNSLCPQSVRYAEVAAVIAQVLNETGYFPSNARPWQEGQVVREGAILQKLSRRRFRLILQRSQPSAPTVLAARKESEYRFARTAISAFVDSEWPKGIDGIRVERFGILGSQASYR
jgi:hypothetical protein